MLLLANAVVGFWEEFQAGNAIAALKATLALKARVKRSGTWSDVTARELVPGDLVRLRLGDIVPADALLLDGDAVEVDQSALTGESLPVSRKTGESVYSGSILKRGEIDAVVSATGKATYFGKTAQLVESAHTVSHFQKAVLKIGNYLIILAVVLVILIIGVAVFRGDKFITTLQFALVLTVAAIPVAMPTVLSVTMAVGARLLARKQAIVSRLVAIEELAGMDVLCSDKTGTLTQNKLKLGEPFCVRGVKSDEVIFFGALASRAEAADAIDQAVLNGLKDKDAEGLPGAPLPAIRSRQQAHRSNAENGGRQTIESHQRRAPGHFEAGRQRRSGGGRSRESSQRVCRARLSLAGCRAHGRAGPVAIPRRAPALRSAARRLEGHNRDRQGNGRSREDGHGRPGRHRQGNRRAGRAGNEHSRCQPVRRDEPHQAGQLDDAIEKADGFAQVFPEHKYHIVETLQKRGHIVGMTGDGVNDAPALKKADAGIAVSGATDAARAAADIVLLSPGLSVIIDAIKESRKTFQRMNSYAIYRITETIRVLLFMTLSILVFNFYPVTAVMIVLLALLNDGAISPSPMTTCATRKARSLEHADCAGHVHRPGHRRCGRLVRACFTLASGLFT